YMPRRLQRLGLLAIGMLAVLTLLLGVFLIGSNLHVAELQAAQQTSEARRVAADDARATAESANAAAEEARRATIRQLMVSEAQAALAEGNLDQARARAQAALRADPRLVQAESVLAQAALSPGTRRRLTGHTSAVYAVAFSPDGKMVVSGSGDRTLRVWEGSG